MPTPSYGLFGLLGVILPQYFRHPQLSHFNDNPSPILAICLFSHLNRLAPRVFCPASARRLQFLPLKFNSTTKISINQIAAGIFHSPAGRPQLKR
jgi:hypothetical protein